MSIRNAIQTEFVKRCRKNSAYSMRAYAQFLEIDQSLLSKIFREERKLSRKASARIGAKLGLLPSQVEPSNNEDKYLKLADDEFSTISAWYHFAILELFKTRGFKASIPLIAKRLGIHVAEARDALERLQRLGLIRVENKRTTLISRDQTWSNNETTSQARKLLQKSLLEKSLTALDTVPFSDRDHGSLTVAIDKNRLPELKKKLREIRIELGEFCQNGSLADEVYQLQISFFPLTKAKRTQE